MRTASLRILTPLLLPFFFSACSARFYIRENLAEGQILDAAVVRKPSLEKSMGIFQKYDDVLEGYITGGVVEPGGRALEGAQVRATDESGADIPDFESGVTDEEGMFKVKFSLPIRWNRVDFTGTISVEHPWAVISPKPQFVIRYNGKIGTLAYFAKPMWVPVKNISPPAKPAAPPPPEKKKSDDPFGDSNFGQ